MSLWKMSFTGAVMILVIIVIRALALSRLPKKTFLALWGIVLLRLLVPYSLPSTLSVYSLAERLTRPTETGRIDLPAAPPLTAIPLPGTNVPSQTAVEPTSFTYHPLALVWAIGMLVCAAFFVVTWLRCRREFRESLPVENDFVRDWLASHPLRRAMEIRQSDKISAPLTYGVFHPVILMPKTVDWDDRDGLSYVLTHELVHICRFDAVTKLVLTAALCVHWFNPMVWAMDGLANRDIELSCDEAVVRRFGVHTKSAYAMTLIRMEEKKSGFTPLCSNFSKNAMEERIIAIMKIKKTSWAAVLAALTLIVGVTTAFATTERAENEKETTFGWSDVEWWTAEEYAAWLEQEKLEMQSCIGDQAWNPTDGWYTWTQERMDEAIARYEQTLKDIQNGMKISKPTGDGDAMVLFGYDPDLQVTSADTEMVLSSTEALESVSMDETMVGERQQLTPELLAEYKAHGLTYDEQKKAFFWDGKLIRYFMDSYTLENGVAIIYSYGNGDGVVDVCTIRQAIQNPDGSIDPGGSLIRIEEVGKEEFDSRFVMPSQMAQETAVDGDTVTGTDFMANFARYAPFGVTFVKSGSFGNLYWNGELVDVLVDHAPDGKYQTIGSSAAGGIKIRTVYDQNGSLIGVETIQD